MMHLLHTALSAVLFALSAVAPGLTDARQDRSPRS